MGKSNKEEYQTGMEMKEEDEDDLFPPVTRKIQTWAIVKVTPMRAPSGVPTIQGSSNSKKVRKTK